MNGPVLSGGVIVLVAALLWMLYLLPSWRGRHQYYAAERNAVRLNQALRVLAETSETPEEVRLELSTRTALAQQRLAKRVQAEREAAELARLRAELAAAQADPALRQARARRRVRLAALAVAVVGVALGGIGVAQVLAGGSPLLIWLGGALAALAVLTLQRMASVAARAARRPVAATQEPDAAPRVSPPLHDQGPATWTPRPLPEPLSSVAGSRAQAARAQIDAAEQLRRAERDAQLRERASRMAPEEPTRLSPPAADFASMGYVDDAEIEAHVRRLLERRAAG